MKHLLVFLFIVLPFFSISQAIFQRSTATQTVQDGRLSAQYNLFIPRYLDTTTANIFRGIDTCGAIIFVYVTNSCWYRQCSPKKWVEFGSGTGGGGYFAPNQTSLAATLHNANYKNFEVNNLHYMGLTSGISGRYSIIGMDSTQTFIQSENPTQRLIVGTTVSSGGIFSNFTAFNKSTNKATFVRSYSDSLLLATGIDPTGDLVNQNKQLIKVTPDSILIKNLSSGSVNDSLLVINSDNVVKKISTALFSGAITADNGLTMSTPTNAQLGGTLLKNTNINTGGFTLNINTSTSAINPLTVAAGTGNAIVTTSSGGLATINATNSSSGFALLATGTTNGAVYGTSTGGSGLTGVSANALAGEFLVLPSSTNTIVEGIRLARYSTATAANNIGVSIDLYNQSDNGNIRLSNQIESKLTTATDATRTSQFIITGVNSAVTSDLFTLSGSGGVKLNKYGAGLFTGTPAFDIQTDANGNYIEVAIGGGGSTNSNVGSGYRWVIPLTNNVKTFFGGYAITIDSAINTNGLTVTVDSAALSAKYVRIVDTLGMLSPYLRINVAAATYATISSVALKLNISDSAAMLSPYLRINVAAATYQPIGNYVTSSRNINTTSPITGGGDLSADRTIAINNAAADGSTKGAASFTAADFNATTGNISLDYANGQAATGSVNGFLSSTDWTTFNNKQATISVTTPITLTGASVGMVNQGTTSQVLHGNASGNASFGQLVNADITNSTIDLTAKVTGLLPVANGGTGTATPAIVAGTNVTVSGTWPNQTINSSAGGGGVTKAQVPLKISASGDSVTRRWNVMDYVGSGYVAGTTDATAAIQRAIDSCNAGGGGTVFFPNGIYIVGGALNANNCQILIPSVTVSSTARTTIKLEGETINGDPGGGGLSGGAAVLPPIVGAILKTTLTSGAAGAAVIGTVTGSFNGNNLEVKSLGIQVKNNPAGGGPVVGGINWKFGTNFKFDGVQIFIDTSGYRSTLPTNDVSGIETPNDGGGENYSISNCLVQGFRKGYTIGEHVVLNNANAYICFYGFYVKTGTHTTTALRVGTYWCAYDVYVAGAATFANFKLDGEWQSASKWYDDVASVKDSANLLKGLIYYTMTSAGVGIDNTKFTVSGGSNLKYISDAGGVAGLATDNNFTGKQGIGSASSGTYNLEVTAANAAILTKSNSTTGGASLFVSNDRASLANYAAIIAGGSANGAANIFGLSRADKVLMVADGASNLGLGIGTLVAQPVYFGTNNTERGRFSLGGKFLINKTSDDGANYLQVAGNALFTVAGNATIAATTSSSTSIASLNLNNSAADLGQVFKTSASYSPYKTIGASGFGIYNGTTGNMSFLNDNTTGNINWASGGVSTAQMTLSSAGQLSVNSFATAYVAKTANYTATASDHTIDCTSGTFTVTLPTAVSISGREYVIKNSGTGVISVNGTSSQTLDGVVTYVLDNQYKEVTVQSDNANWKVIGTTAKTLYGSATLDFASTLAGAVTDLTMTVTGAADGDVVSIGVPNGSYPATGTFNAWVSAANTVTIRYANNSLTLTQDPASGTFKAKVFKD